MVSSMYMDNMPARILFRRPIRLHICGWYTVAEAVKSFLFYFLEMTRFASTSSRLTLALRKE